MERLLYSSEKLRKGGGTMISMEELEKLLDIADVFKNAGGKWLLRVRSRKVHVYRVRLGNENLTRIDVYDAKEEQK